MSDKESYPFQWSEDQVTQQCDHGRHTDPALSQFVSHLQQTEEVQPSELLKGRILSEIKSETVPASSTPMYRWIPLAALFVFALGLWVLLRQQNPPDDQVKTAHHRGLEWLVAEQQPDGHWQPSTWGGNEQFTTGVTALSLMALLQSEHADRHKAATERATRYLSKTLQVRPSKDNQAFSYNHNLATLALLESYALNPNERVRTAIDRALTTILKQQSAVGGWGYQTSTGLEYGTPAAPNAAISVWPLAVISRAKELGWENIGPADARGKQWLTSLIDQNGLIGYRSQGDFPHGPTTLLAMGLTCLSEDAKGLTQNLDQLNPQSRDMYELFFTARALESNAADRLQRLQESLARQQVKDGSWESEGSWKLAGGKVYATAMASLSLSL